MPLFYNMQYKYQVSPECVCDVSAQNTSQIIYYIIFKMLTLSGNLMQMYVPLNANELLLPAHCLYSGVAKCTGFFNTVATGCFYVRGLKLGVNIS